MFEKAKKRIRYKVLRSRIAKLSLDHFTMRELEIINFVKGVLRGSDSIIISDDMIKVTKGTISLSMENDRLISVDENRYLDVKVGELVRRMIMEYTRKVVHHRSFLFSKLCDRQVLNIVAGFQEPKQIIEDDVRIPCPEKGMDGGEV